MTHDLEKLLNLLEVEQIDKYLFSGDSPKHPSRIFGGQVLAQSLNAALRTVDATRIAHSLHAYFLRPGNPEKKIIYEVDPIRDGKSFTTRSVVARQDSIAIFNVTVSFHSEEPGLMHQCAMPQIPAPEELESDYDRMARLAKEKPGIVEAQIAQPIERKTVYPRDVLDPQPQEPLQHVWVRALGNLGNELSRHQTVLAYISDFALLGTAIMAHPYTGMSKNLQWASLDHALWFHRPFRADDYLLYSMDSPITAGGRGFSRGAFYTRDGVLVASAAQESLLRLIQS